MARSWDDVEKQAESGPWGAFRLIAWGIVVLFVLGMLIWFLGSMCAVANNAQQTAMQEFSPSALLAKYEWFKDAHAALDAKRANLAVYERRLVGLEKSYGENRGKWPADERERAGIWESEQAGIAASYNLLAADYNAQMAKFNWRFTNLGDLPAGATEVLPRSVAPYTTTDRSEAK